MFESTKANKGSGGIGKKYKYDYRKDGKLDITFIRTSKKWKELKDKSVNTQMGHYFLQFGGFNNKKKTYFLWTDANKGNQSGDAGVGIGGVFAKSNRMSVDKNLIQTNLHELLHTQLMGMICMKGMKKIHYTSHYNGGDDHMLSALPSAFSPFATMSPGSGVARRCSFGCSASSPPASAASSEGFSFPSPSSTCAANFSTSMTLFSAPLLFPLPVPSYSSQLIIR